VARINRENTMLFPSFMLALAVAQGPADWYEPFPAHKVIGNVYYVGSKDLATYLITTPEGHILINSGFERTVPLIQKSVESLGFKMSDVKILLASHAHSDHVAGHAALQKLTGARVHVMRGDDQVIASGGKGQYLYGTERWDPCKVDRVLNDRDEVKLGGVTLVARLTPGHTRGCTTWTWRVEEGGKKYDVVVIGSPNVNPGYQLVSNKDYPEIARDFARTFEVLKSLPCDVFLGAHGAYYGMIEKHSRIKKGQPNPFVDPDGYKDYVAQKERAFRKTLAQQQEEWPPARQKESEFTGRKLEVYQHGSRKEWGYAEPQRDTFLVLHPKQPRASSPLYVVLHSAGHDVHSCLACTTRVGNHDIYRSPDDFFALYLDCRANKGDWWWGINKYPGPEVSPTEKRCIDTVKWVVKQYGIDENRVYLCGNSMGGSGTLGIGMRHGDVFAAIKANVPAEVKHVSSRMYFPPQTVPEGVALPDPPIVIDYSAQNDDWSRGHDGFVKAMTERKYALFMYWGPFGHANNHENILKVNDLINSFDWLSVKKNEAYPVFTNASTNDALPWPNKLADKKSGQINAFFRWKNVSDTADTLETTLFLVKPADIKKFTIPTEATADVSLRRLQMFRIAPAAKVRWTYGASKGEVQADAAGCITIPQLKITPEPTKLTVSSAK
jgi:metallo-beta-lactamase class B